MITYDNLPTEPLPQPSYLTIGSFDGVHRGHQELITRMVAAAHAAGCQAGVMTFDPHPLAVLRPDLPLAQLTSPAERTQLIAALGADFALALPFTRETANTTASDFMRALVERLNLRMLWIGPDFALGRGREGNVERLAEIGQQMGYGVETAPPFDLDGGPVRSSRVRALLAEDGAAEQAAALLGRPYQVWGTVQQGARRGRTLGYPTANLALPPERLIPAYGVYACWAWLGGDTADADGDWSGRPAAVSIGVRPTFDNGHPTIEAYLLDFDADLYGQTMGLSFVSRLRPELRFNGPGALIEQMARDVAATRTALAAPPHDAVATREGWQELEHTADWAIEVRGDDPRQLFARAAAALYALQDADPARPATRARALSVRADRPDELMVTWLNRLLLAQELGGEMYTRFRIHEISDRALNGVAYGYPGAPVHTGVKAVTYYDLNVSQDETGWRATVTFDV